MSMPYFVHKNDLEDYKKYRDECRLLKDKEQTLYKQFRSELLSALDCTVDNNRNIENEAVDKASDAVSSEYIAVQKKYEHVRIMSLFTDEDRSDYIPHFLGARIDTDRILSGLVDVADNGIHRCKKIIEGT